MSQPIVVINAPSILGLRPSGVEEMPAALEKAGIASALNASGVRSVAGGAYSPKRDEATQLLNPGELSAFSARLADAVGGALGNKQFPLVIGGDCSIIIGAMLALRRKGRYGLFFADAHADFYQPSASPTGEAADMDLALVSGRGPEVITNLEGRKPLVQDKDIVLFGQRDRQETIDYGSQQVQDTAAEVYELGDIEERGVRNAAHDALRHLLRQPLDGCWVHVDVDVLDDAVMPAVDYHLPGGLSFEELAAVLKIWLSSGDIVGMSVSIFNPKLDPTGELADKLVKLLVESLSVS